MATTPIDLNSAQYKYRRTVGDGSAQTTTYGLEMSVGGQDYTFVPNSVVSKGLSSGGNQYVLPWFLNRDNLAKFGEIGIPVDAANFPETWISDYLKDKVNASTQGVLIPTGSLGFDGEVRTFENSKGAVTGMGERNGQLVYLQDRGGASDRYMTSSGDIQTITTSGGGGGFFDFFDDIVSGVSDIFSGIDDAVNELPGGWATVALVAGGAALANAAQTASVSLAEAGAGAAGAGASAGTGLTLGGGGLGLSAGGGGLGITAGSAGAGAIGGSLGTTLAGITTGVGAGAALAGLEAGSGTGLLSSGTGLTTGGSGLGLTSEGGLGLTTGSAGASTIGAGLGETLAAIDTGIASGVGGAVTSSMLSAISKATGISVDNLKTFAPSVIKGLLSAGGSYLQSEQAKEAAKIQADAQIEAARIAADAARFRPVGVTTRFGSSNFTTDAQGNVIGAGYTPSAEITGYQDRLRTLAGQGMTDIEGARAAYQPLTGAAQSLFGLGQGYLNRDLGQPITSMGQQYMQSQAGQPLTQLGQQYIASDVGQPLTSLGQQYLQKSPDQIAADYITKQQALLAPTQENQLAQLQNRLFQQGRGGAATAQGGNLMATSPEMAAYYNALAQSNLQLAANAGQAGQQQTQFGADLYARGLGLTSGRQVQGADLYRQGTGLTQAQQLAGADLYRQGTGLTMEGQKFGAGLFGTGANLQNAYYTGQTGAYAPFATAMNTSVNLENLAQQPLNLGVEIGGRTTAGAAAGGRFLSEGITGAARTRAPGNAYSGTGNALTSFAENPLVARGLENIFDSTPISPSTTIPYGSQLETMFRQDPVTGQYIPVR